MNNLPEFMKGKRFMLIVGGLVVLLLVLMIFAGQTRTKSESEVKVEPAPEIQPTQTTNFLDETEVVQSPEVKKAIQEQMQADQEYATWQDTNMTNYPWLRKLPLTSQKYFVYFDLSRKTFVGRLYTKPEDDVEAMKNAILQILKVDEEIPVENFTVEWQVNP